MCLLIILVTTRIRYFKLVVLNGLKNLKMLVRRSYGIAVKS